MLLDEGWIVSAEDSGVRSAASDEHEVSISHLRDCLGVVYLHVARTNEPAIIARYGNPEVVMVPLWEWRWLKQIEEAIRAGEIDAENWLAELGDPQTERKEAD